MAANSGAARPHDLPSRVDALLEYYGALSQELRALESQVDSLERRRGLQQSEEALKRRILEASWSGHDAWERTIKEVQGLGLDAREAAKELEKLSRAKQAKAEAQEGEFYSNMSSIEKALANDDTALLKASWLLEQSKADDFVLSRRQELPSCAMWNADELMLRARKDEKDPERVQIVAISYCWFTPVHPDPKGEQVKIIALAIDLRFAVKADPDSTGKEKPVYDLGIFFDLCSMYQKAYASPFQEQSFKHSLSNVNIWYAHSKTAVWILSKQSENFPESLPYDDRGWPTFELAISAILTDRKWGLDLGMLDDTCDTWGRVAWGSDEAPAVCAADRPPPLLPSDFAKVLDTKIFTNGADREFVAGKYAQTFEEVTACARCLNFHGLKWGDEAVRGLAKVLPHFICLKLLILKENRISDIGAIALAEAIPRCPSLIKLKLAGNEITNDGQVKLRQAWTAAGKDELPKNNLDF